MQAARLWQICCVSCDRIQTETLILQNRFFRRAGLILNPPGPDQQYSATMT